MTQNAFLRLCNKYLIPPELALENDAIAAALGRRDDAEVERLLAEEF